MYSSILIAPSAYKGTLSAAEVAQAMSVGVETALPGVHIVQAPVADGGDGTLDALHMAIGGTRQFVDVLGALDQPVRASWLPIEHQGTNTAVIELACASGLGMLFGLELKPMQAHTLGIGMVLLDCLERGYKNIVVCVGGSASTDGGSGLLHALGAKFFDGEGAELSLGGGALSAIVSCDLSPLKRWRDVRIAVATDVTSPLLGPNGAAFIFGPQKGASAKQVFALDACLAKFADVLEAASGNKVRTAVGAGAAGGTAFGLACAMNARVVSGFQWVCEMIDLHEKIRACDLVLTGEGCLDEQSLVGKAAGELARLCRVCNKPLWAVSGLCSESTNWEKLGFSAVKAVSVGGSIADAHGITKTVAALLKASSSS